MATRKLIGTDPDQVSVNGDLGTLAFQDSESVRVTTLQADNDIIVNSARIGRGQINAGLDNSTNLVFGNQVLFSNTTGVDNIAIGLDALYSNTTGMVNLAIGRRALYSNITGSNNVAFGTNTLQFNTTGSLNMGVGLNTLFNNTTGSENVGIGVSAVSFNTTGNYNVGIGRDALRVGTTGSNNTAVGYRARRNGTTGELNTVIGSRSGENLTTGSKNTIIGTFNGNQLGLDIRTTSNNIVLSDGDGNPRQYYDGTNNAWVWQTAGSERARIDSAGNLGIGTTSLGAKVHIETGDLLTTSLFVKGINTEIYAPTNNGGYGVFLITSDVGSTRSNKFQVLASGSVGINGASPQTPLDVISNASGYGITLRGRSSDNVSSFRFTSNDYATQYASLDSGSAYLLFGISGTEQMRLTSTGLGIGTNNPAPGTPGTKSLDATGPLLSGGAINTHQTSRGVFQYANNETSIRSYGATAGTGQIVFTTGGGGGGSDTERMRIDSAGNVGIGVTPSAWATYKVLQVANASISTVSTAATAFAHNWFWNGTNNTYINDGFATVYTQGSGVHRWLSAPSGTAGTTVTITERMRLDASGNLGIGTTVPLGRLDVKGKGNSYLDGLNIVDSSNAAKTSFVHTAGSLFVGIANNASGADASADFEQRIRIYEPTTTATDPILQLGDPDFTILQNGNIGIGTNTPTALLHISGPTFPLARIERTTSLTSAVRSTISVVHKTSADMTDGFGADISFSIVDSSGVDNEIGMIGVLRDGADNSGAFQFRSYNAGSLSEKLRITSTGNVGIGTTAPGVKLDVIGNGRFYSAAANTDLSVGRLGDAIYYNTISLFSGYNSAVATQSWSNQSGQSNYNFTADLVFYQWASGTSYAERARINSTGLGIGTSAPAAKLHVVGTSSEKVIINMGGGSTPTSDAALNVWSNAFGTSTVARFGFSDTAGGNRGGFTFNDIASPGDWGVPRMDMTQTYGGASEIRSLLGTEDSTWAGMKFTSQTTANAALSTSPTFVWNNYTTEQMRITSGGNVGIGTTTPTYKLEVNGSFAATTKSFVIPHPTKPNKKLRYGSLEGPENGVYLRGKLTAPNDTIELPEYWTKLVDPDSITVQLTSIGKHQELYVKDISNNCVLVGGLEGSCFYVIFAERVDVDKLEVEID